VLELAQAQCGAALTGFELMSDLCLQLVIRHFPPLRLPFNQASPQYLLLELSDSESEAHASAMLESVVGAALEQELITDAVVAASIAQSKSLWLLRENISMAQAHEGKNIKHDISVPISRIGEFIRVTDRLLQAASPGCRMVTFGHLGDGNLHYNVSPRPVSAMSVSLPRRPEINRVVHDSVDQFGGSISAEHGLGALKREEILRYKSPTELKLMRSIKQALDPHNLMNPGKVL